MGNKSSINRFPAEWENHEATILSWPANTSDWPGKFVPIHWVYSEIVKKLAEDEKVYLLVQDYAQRDFVQKILYKARVNTLNVTYFIFQSDRNWMRDSCPAFVITEDDGQRARRQIHFHFNGWAKYPNWEKDFKLPSFLSGNFKDELVEARFNQTHVVLEGGAIDTNGAGTLLTTEECLLSDEVQVRNPGFTARDYEKVFDDYLGIKHVIWLGKGIAGDDTHGHVDDLCRFVNEDTVLLCRETNSMDENYSILEENHERLQGAVTATGKKINVVNLPMPRALEFEDLRLPASYANFYIANKYVLVPTFNDPNDRTALGIIQELFADKLVCGIHAVDLVWGLGTLHCLSHELPAV